MGFENREYMRDDHPWQTYERGLRSRTPMSMTVMIIIACVAVFVMDMFSGTPKSVEGLTGLKRLSYLFSLNDQVFVQPWNVWKLLTYGFAHSPRSLWHIGGNMLMLFIFGRAIETKLGRNEFLTFYLLAIVFCGIVWAGFRQAWGPGTCVGASGAVTAVFMMFVISYPKEKLWIWGVIQTPAWLLGVIVIGSDLAASFYSKDNVAHDAHLAGAAFGAMYLYFGWNFQQFLPKSNPLKSMGQPRLKIHDPEPSTPRDTKQDLKADEILAKIHNEGEESLTRKERKILEDYSRRMKQKHQ